MFTSVKQIPNPNRRFFAVRYQGIALFITLVFFITLIIDGVLRYYFRELHIYPATYFPKILLFLFFIIFLLRFWKKYTRLQIIFIVIALSAIWAAFHLKNIYQILFGFWVIIPFLFGCVIGKFFVEEPSVYLKASKYLFLIAATGVILNPFFSYPWIGAHFHFLGAELTTSRYWTTYWYERYPGYSHSAINAAAQVIIFATLSVTSNISRVTKLAIWAIAGIAIYLTTSKGMQVTYMLLTVYFSSLAILHSSYSIRYFWAGVGLILVFTVISVPLSSIFLRLDVQWSSIWYRFFYGSYFLRLHSTWPNVWGSLDSVWQWMMGNGLGAVGSAERIYGSGIALPGDNLFVFLAATVGPILSGLFLLFVTYRGASSFVRKSSISYVIYPLLLIVLTYGEVSDIIDGTASLAIILGIVTFFTTSLRKYKPMQQDAETKETVS